MSFAEYTVFGGDPLAVIERRRRSPLGLSGAVGAAAAADDDDATDDEEREDGAPSAEGEGRRAPRRAAPARKTGVRPPENDREDLVRVRRALQESTAPGADLAFGRTVGGPDDGALGAAPVLAQSAARALRRFQAAAGLKVDGLARPGGPTDAALDNRRRRVWRLAAQGRRPE
ncbi:MAG: hypothetical protein RIB45_01460, partial [Marivibrio sp.]|uniref:hypothetical protein n=1 Tax=Marivibrio sp. TaxID=2039719 RepID=UPI0032EAC3EE